MTDTDLTNYLSLAADGAAIAEKATEPPWFAKWCDGIDYYGISDDSPPQPAWMVIPPIEKLNHADYRIVCRTVRTTKESEPQDAAHIADARTRVPALAAAVMTLVEEVRRLETLLASLIDGIKYAITKLGSHIDTEDCPESRDVMHHLMGTITDEQGRAYMTALDAANCTLDDEEAAHQETLRMWQAAKAEVERLRYENRLHRDKANGDYWAWGGDGEDHPESLVCPVLISANQLRGLLAETDRLKALLAVRDSEVVAAVEKIAENLHEKLSIPREEIPGHEPVMELLAPELRSKSEYGS